MLTAIFIFRINLWVCKIKKLIGRSYIVPIYTRMLIIIFLNLYFLWCLENCTHCQKHIEEYVNFLKPIWNEKMYFVTKFEGNIQVRKTQSLFRVKNVQKRLLYKKPSLWRFTLVVCKVLIKVFRTCVRFVFETDGVLRLPKDECMVLSAGLHSYALK